MNKTKERIINLHIEKLPEGEYLATSTDIPGLVAQGMTIAETVSIAKEVAKEIYLSCLEHGDPLSNRYSNKRFFEIINKILPYCHRKTYWPICFSCIIWQKSPAFLALD